MSSETTTIPSSPWGKPATAPGTGSPWGRPNAVKPCSLADVISEQKSEELATELQNRENAIYSQERHILEDLKLEEAATGSPEVLSASCQAASAASEQLSDAELAAKLAAEDGGCDPNDEMIALMLQKQFDREFDVGLSKREQKYNGNCKVVVSFDNYKRRHVQTDYQNAEDVEDEDDDFYEEELPEHPNQSQWENGTPSIGGKGYVKHGDSIITKHDKVICGRRNAQRLMKFPPEFVSGDGEGMDMQLPNRVYNKLKQHSLSENKKGHKVKDNKDHSTAIKAVDEKTRMLIFKMINAEFLTSVDGVVSEGKEAVVLKAVGGRKDNVELPHDVILKVYKTSMNEFKTRLKYVQGDYRLSKDAFKKFNSRKLMQMWAEKEFLNLRRMQRNGVLCPIPLVQKKQVLAMSCIGGDRPAPKLKDVVFSTEDIQDAFEQTVELMKLMFHKCNMVHADFSAYNLLWHQKKVWVIDVGQAVDRDNPSSNSFLFRDCRNVCEFFKQGGVHGVPSAEKLFNEVTNYDFEGEGKVFESQVHRYDQEGYAFDFFFEMSESARSQKLLNGDSSDSDSEVDGGDDDGGDEGEAERLQCDSEEAEKKEEGEKSVTDS